MPPLESYRDDYTYRVDDNNPIRYHDVEYSDDEDSEDDTNETYILQYEEECIYSNLKQANKEYSHHCSFFYPLTFLTIGFSGLTYISFKPTLINISSVGVVAASCCAYLTKLYLLNKECREYKEKYDEILNKKNYLLSVY